MSEKTITVQVINKKHYGRTLNYSFGTVVVDADGYAEVPEDIAKANPLSFKTNVGKQIPAKEKIEAIGKEEKKSIASLPSSKESTDEKEEKEITESNKSDSDGVSNEDIEASNEGSGKTDAEVIEELEKELHKKTAKELKALAMELKIPMKRVNTMSKTGLVKFLARKI